MKIPICLHVGADLPSSMLVCLSCAGDCHFLNAFRDALETTGPNYCRCSSAELPTVTYNLEASVFSGVLRVSRLQPSWSGLAFLGFL